MLVLVTIAIVMDFWRYASVMVQLLLAAVCVYLLGLFFASIASAIPDLRGSPDVAGHRSADSSDYVYLSFISLATVALGAFVPAQRPGRALAVLDVPMGQLYSYFPRKNSAGT